MSYLILSNMYFVTVTNRKLVLVWRINFVKSLNVYIWDEQINLDLDVPRLKYFRIKR